ncbi:MAG: hypothetical protein VX554_04005 [Candidatus Thermoplasmatota archaeon]|nr:hypothetical protein [Candidatus Thermoplasmatota archaeon]MEE3208240.1 hypothetical protein [Candidatus Thermoplasmatota archaeon]
MSDEEYPEFTAPPVEPETKTSDYGAPLAILGGLLVLIGFGLGLQAYMTMSDGLLTSEYGDQQNQFNLGLLVMVVGILISAFSGLGTVMRNAFSELLGGGD